MKTILCDFASALLYVIHDLPQEDRKSYLRKHLIINTDLNGRDIEDVIEHIDALINQ